MKIRTQIPINAAATNQFRLNVRTEDEFGAAGLDWTTGREDPELSLTVGLGQGVFYSPQTGVSVELGGDFAGLTVSQDGSVTYALDGAGQINPTGPFNGTRVTQTQEGATVDPDGPGNTVRLTEQTGALVVDPAGPGNQISLTQTEQGVLFDPVGPNNNYLVSRDDNTITIADEHNRRTSISRRGSVITINPHGLGNSTSVRLGEGLVEIDLPGLGKALNITPDQGGYSIDSPGFGNTTRITRHDNVVTIDPPGLGNSSTITHSQAGSLINAPGLGNSVDVIPDRPS